MQMKTSLWGETAWPGFNSASSPGLMTPIAVTMKAQFWPWQQCYWGKTEGQIRVQKAGTDPEQQMACNDSSIRKFLRANWADWWVNWVDTSLKMALSLGSGSWSLLDLSLREIHLECVKWAALCSQVCKERSNPFRLIEQNPLPVTGAAMLLLPHRHHWPLPAQFRGQQSQPKLLLAVWETFLPPLQFVPCS